MISLPLFSVCLSLSPSSSLHENVLMLFHFILSLFSYMLSLSLSLSQEFTLLMCMSLQAIRPFSSKNWQLLSYSQQMQEMLESGHALKEAKYRASVKQHVSEQGSTVCSKSRSRSFQGYCQQSHLYDPKNKNPTTYEFKSKWTVDYWVSDDLKRKSLSCPQFNFH